MNILPKIQLAPEPMAVRVTADTVTIDLADSRTISVPLSWFPRLFHGTEAERQNFELSAGGVYWPESNEDVPVEGLLRGEKSGESLKSIRRCLDLRARPESVRRRRFCQCRMI